MLHNLLNPGIQITENFSITYYALCIVTGMLVAFGLITLLFRRRNMSADLFLSLFCVCLPICLVCTRAFYCITDEIPLRYWFDWESLQAGGLSIVGGILGGLVSVFLFCMIKKINFPTLPFAFALLLHSDPTKRITPEVYPCTLPSFCLSPLFYHQIPDLLRQKCSL